MPNVAIINNDDWHAQRAQNIGASEVAALFGLSPYTTKFTLWHQKAGKLLTPDFDSERIKWGNRLESAIAQGIAEDNTWTIRKVHRYITHPVIQGMGASLDYEIVNHPDGAGCFEIKNISYEAWKSRWQVNEDGSIEAPIDIELQLQHQLAVTNREWGAIGFLVSGNEARTVVRKRHEPTIQKIEAAVKEFWESIEKGEVPPVECSEDLAALTQLFTGKQTIKVDSEEFAALCTSHKMALADRAIAQGGIDYAEAKIVAFLDNLGAEIALGNGFKATYKEQKRAAYMVEACKYRVLRVTNWNGEKGE